MGLFALLKMERKLAIIVFIISIVLNRGEREGDMAYVIPVQAYQSCFCFVALLRKFFYTLANILSADAAGVPLTITLNKFVEKVPCVPLDNRASELPYEHERFIIV